MGVCSLVLRPFRLKVQAPPDWGIEPVAADLRQLSGVDVLVLWWNLGISLLLLVAGALLVPALGLRDALLAILVGASRRGLVVGVGAVCAILAATVPLVQNRR